MFFPDIVHELSSHHRQDEEALPKVILPAFLGCQYSMSKELHAMSMMHCKLKHRGAGVLKRGWVMADHDADDAT